MQNEIYIYLPNEGPNVNFRVLSFALRMISLQWIPRWIVYRLPLPYIEFLFLSTFTFPILIAYSLLRLRLVLQYLLCHCSMLTQSNSVWIRYSVIVWLPLSLHAPALHSNMWMEASFCAEKTVLFFNLCCAYISKRLVHYLCVNFSHFKRVFNFIVIISLPQSVQCTYSENGEKRKQNRQYGVRRYLFIQLI